MYFIGVTTGQSSIMRVFPAWADYLGLGATLHGVDLRPGAEGSAYREVVNLIREDPRAAGALVTTHKLDLLRSARELFDELDEDAELLGEISSIAKRDGRLVGSAKDPQTSGLALNSILGHGYWTDRDADVLLLGAGGAALALTLHLHRQATAGGGAPRRVILTDSGASRLRTIRAAHRRIGLTIPVDYVEVAGAADNDHQLARLREGSVVVNATGRGKDLPGSPLTGAVNFPRAGIAWDFNYRGELPFLAQARARQAELSLRVADGWEYFVHGWTRVIADVFGLDIPVSGTRFQALSEIAHHTTAGDRP